VCVNLNSRSKVDVIDQDSGIFCIWRKNDDVDNLWLFPLAIRLISLTCAAFESAISGLPKAKSPKFL
jgi:hypothetical protein